MLSAHRIPNFKCIYIFISLNNVLSFLSSKKQVFSVPKIGSKLFSSPKEGSIFLLLSIFEAAGFFQVQERPAAC